MEITSNNNPRPILCWDDLSPRERAEFDYVGDDPYGFYFFRYLGVVYDLGEFSRIPAGIQHAGWAGWHGYRYDSYFSGVLVKLDRRGDTVIVGRYCC